MRDIVYEVTAHCPDPRVKDAYVSWLGAGHVQAVLDGGARHAMITVYEERGGWAVESRYVFSSQADYEAYESGPASSLRSLSETRFGGPVAFDRKVGNLAFRLP